MPGLTESRFRAVSLSREEVEALRPLLSGTVLASTLDERGAVATVTKAQAEALRDLLTDEVARVGFDAAYSVTKRGRLLEDLIDRFFEP